MVVWWCAEKGIYLGIVDGKPKYRALKQYGKNRGYYCVEELTGKHKMEPATWAQVCAWVAEQERAAC